MDRLKFLNLLLMITLVQLGARVWACVSLTRFQLLFDLIMCSCRVIADQIVKYSHVAIDSLKELLLVLFHFGLNRGLLCHQLLMDELLDVIFDTRSN